MGDYMCWSAPVNDLGNWRCEGVIYPRNADPMNKDGSMCLYAPDVTVGLDGRYYLYYVLDKVGVMSVAVCDEPAGTYTFYGYVHYKDGTRLGERAGDEPQFDPGVLTEGDKTYMYSGFCPKDDKSRTGSKVVTLDKDMLTVITEPQQIVPGICYSAGTQFEGHAFFEASSIRKVNGKYYFIYSSEVMHELCYAVSDNPLKGFRYGGVLVSNTDLYIDTYKPAEMPAIQFGQIVSTDLTASEMAVLRELMSGASNKEIGKRLYMSESTVKRYIADMLAKTGFKSRLQLAIEARGGGLVINHGER